MTRSAVATLAVLGILTGCDRAGPLATQTTEPPTSAQTTVFPIEAFADLGDEPVSALAAELQEVLDESANGHGITATLITPQSWAGGSWPAWD